MANVIKVGSSVKVTVECEGKAYVFEFETVHKTTIDLNVEYGSFSILTIEATGVLKNAPDTKT